MSHKFNRNESPHKFIYNCGLSPVFFKLYWLNENFFTSTNPEYYNGDWFLDPDNRYIYSRDVYFNYGQYTKYGYCMSILYELLCDYDCRYDFIPVCNKDETAIVYLFGCEEEYYEIADSMDLVNITKVNDLHKIDSTDMNKNIDCDSCTNCLKCVNCSNCNNCNNCLNCKECTNCNYCNNCSNCYNVH